MKRYLMPILLLFVALALTACATGPRYDLTGVDRGLEPARAVAEMEQRRGQPVVWGGTIIRTHNLEDRTRIEVLAYPLDADQRPRSGRSPQGRFLIDYPGYLESADYASGRLLTVRGQLEQTHEGRVGDARYRYPVVEAERLHLWEREPERARQPRVSFGVGVMLGR